MLVRNDRVASLRPVSVFSFGRLLVLAFVLGSARLATAHIVPPEQFHPVAESYRRMSFILNLNPILWTEVASDARTIATNYEEIDAAAARSYLQDIERILAEVAPRGEGPSTLPAPALRKRAAQDIFERTTPVLAELMIAHLDRAAASLDRYATASQAIDEARKIWAGFEHEVKATDRTGFMQIGRAWLSMSSALGAPGIHRDAASGPDRNTFELHSQKVISYVQTNFGDNFSAPAGSRLAPLPRSSATFDSAASVPAKLPPGHNINKQLPRPRQILNIAERGVDESETPLIAIGDMAFDSAYIFGEPAQSLQISCNTCHNKGVTNPQFEIPGLSPRGGVMDVSNAFFAPHANNATYDPVDIPDIRGIRFTAPYGRNGRFATLREFTRNVIVGEFNGPEPDPLLLDAIVAYLNEIDFLPNPALQPDGRLNERASTSARRGEELFNRSFEGMGNRSCATCHIPSANFLDHKRHDIGTVAGASPYSRDRTMDTPTLLSGKFTAPYFHDGSQPTLRAVNDWFNEHFELGLNQGEIGDLTAYVETIGDGVDGYEDSIHTLEPELEEFKFFLSGYEFLKSRNKQGMLGVTFQTIASELHAHKWDVQNLDYLPILNELASLMEDAYAATLSGDEATVEAKVAAYRQLYAANADRLK